MENYIYDTKDNNYTCRTCHYKYKLSEFWKNKYFCCHYCADHCKSNVMSLRDSAKKVHEQDIKVQLIERLYKKEGGWLRLQELLEAIEIQALMEIELDGIMDYETKEKWVEIIIESLKMESQSDLVTEAVSKTADL